MALITIGAYSPPDPGLNNYHTTPQRVERTRENARGVTIGEFQRIRYVIEWGYNWLAKADYDAIVAALGGLAVSGPIAGVSVVFWDKDAAAYTTGTFLLQPPQADLFRLSTTTEYTNVLFTLVEQ